ncbi:MAG: ABC transporter permease [Angelakisella sp.]|nr:ABC transporter permease [Angelakisella sp.]
MKSKKGINSEAFTIIAFFVLFAIVCGVFQAFAPSFLTLQSITTMLKTSATIAIAALGLTFVIIVNHSDISFYMTCCFSSMFMAWLIAKSVHPVIAVLGGLIAGAAWGLVSGLAVGKFKLPDIISTIAIGSIAFGAAYIFSNGAFIYDNFHTCGIISLSEGRFLGVTASVWIMFALYLAAYYILEKSRWGRHFYAVGSNKKAAFFSGINVNKIIIIAFVISGMLAALAAMIYDAAQGQGNVKIGLSFLMPCFSAIYIGWSVFRKPCVVGTFFGALLATVITTGFTVLSIPYYWSDITMAFVLIMAIGLSKVEFKPKDASKGKKVA